MKDSKMFFLYLAFFFFCTACTDDYNSSNEGHYLFSYHPASGQCRNSEGETGYNPFDLAYIQRTRNAECVDLSNQVLITLVEGKSRESLSYDSLYDFNFRGAKFDSAELFFNQIVSSDFSGADLRLLQYGYAYIAGKTDKFTLLPNEGSCEKDKNQIVCYR